MARLSLLKYLTVSLIFGSISVFYAFVEHEQFYPTTVALTTSKTHVLVMGNLGFALAVTCGSFAQRLLFGEITDDESREVLEKAKYTFIDICICLTIFRTDLTVTVVSLFTLLLLAKVFHWIAELRVETVSRLRLQHYFQIIRVALSLVCLFVMDLIITAGFIYVIVHLDSFGVLILFTFEFTMLMISTCANLLRFIILLIDSQRENEWDWKYGLLFCVEFTFDVLKLTSYVGFFVILTKYYSMPIHLLRELYFSLSNVRKRFEGYVKYKRLLKALQTRFPTVRVEQFEGQDRDMTCIICRSDVDVGKQLPCGHIFHLNCLKQWFQEQASCPTCRFDLSSRNVVNIPQVVPVHLQPNRNNPPLAAPAAPIANNNNVLRPNVAQNNANAEASNSNQNRPGMPPNPMSMPPFSPMSFPNPHRFLPNNNMPPPMPPPNMPPFPGMPFPAIPPPNMGHPAFPMSLPQMPNRGPVANPDLKQNIDMIQRSALATLGLFQYHSLLATHYDNLLTQLNTLQNDWETDFRLLLNDQQNQSSESKPSEDEKKPEATENSKPAAEEEQIQQNDKEPEEEDNRPAQSDLLVQ